MPPALEGTVPRPRVRWILYGQSRVHALPGLTGVERFEELTPLRISGLTKAQRGGVFAVAVRAGQPSVAERIEKWRAAARHRAGPTRDG